MTFASAIHSAVNEVLADARHQYSQLVGGHLEAGENLLAFQTGEKRRPLIVRLLPLVPDFIRRPKRFVLAITNRRVVIVQVKQSLIRGRTTGSRLVTACPLAEVQAVTPKTGMLTSSVTIQTRRRGTFRYSGMLQSAAERFARDVQKAAQETGQPPAGPPAS